MPHCWRISKYSLDTTSARLSIEYQQSNPTSNLPVVLQQCFPGLHVSLIRTPWLTVSPTEEYSLQGKIPSGSVMGEVLDLLSECISVCDCCDCSHCLDRYRIPDEATDPERWPHTPIGILALHAKYRNDLMASRRLQSLIVRFVNRHPALLSAEAVCPMPRSSSSDGINVPLTCAEGVAKSLGIPLLAMQRTRATRPQKDIESREEREANQRESMSADASASGTRVLVIDDLYMDGATMAEACRALKAVGATRVFGLCAAKTPRGMSGGF